MTIRLLLFLISFFMFSCASIRLDETYKLAIKSDKVAKIKYQDSIYNLPAEIEVYRSKTPLKFIYIKDSTQKRIQVKRVLHPNFVYGNIPIYSFGYFIDLMNSKRFYYGKTLIFDANDSIKMIREPLFDSPKVIGLQFVNHFKKVYPNKKGNFAVTISIPTACNFEMRPLDEKIKKSIGFGISIGADYYYKKNKFLTLNFAAFTDRFRFANAYYGEKNYEFEKLFSSNVSLTDNFIINRLTFGYGLNFSKNSWNYEKYEDLETFYSYTRKSKINYNLGFAFTSYYQLFKCFYVGLNYRPTILQTYPTTSFTYNHVFGLDYQFKF